ncbi:MAG: S8 family serine peptidase [Elusimicrobia bacterium]|nr:S8 family serine peptidase [Elusimicrobiota bacterium]
MPRKLLALALALYLAFPTPLLFAQQVRVAPVEVAPAAVAAVGGSIVPLAVGGAAFQSQVAALTSVHIAQITPLISNPAVAAQYLSAQRAALPQDPQAATAQLASLALVGRAIASPLAGAASLAAGNAELGKQLAALNAAVLTAPAQQGAKGSIAPLIETAVQLSHEGEPALQVAHLFDGVDASMSDGARLAEGGWRTPMATRLATETRIEAGLLDKLPESVRKKVMELKSQRDAARERMESIANMGTQLQAWGLPNVVSVDQNKALRYSRIYRMNGMPTDLGMVLYETLKPLIDADPALLGRITQAQLHEAVQILNDSLAYRMQPDSDDMQMQARLIAGAKFDEGFDYAEQRGQLMAEAREVLKGPPAPGEQPAGFKETPVELRPSSVMIEVLKDTVKKFGEMQEKAQNGEATEEDLKPIVELVLALHAAMGLPIQTGPGQMAMITVKHEQLRPLIAELTRRKIDESVIGAVVRSFPLGESIWRLGVHKLWANGLTGKGIKVAVVDNGVDFGHPDLQGSGTIFKNMTYDRGDHTKGGHGTPMASILHAIAPDAEIMSYQAWSNANLPGVVLNEEESLRATLKAMDDAVADGADIISMSGGFTMGYGSDTISKKASELAAKGIVLIVSAGNEGGDLPPGAQVRSPASSNDVIAVGAVDYHLKKAEFSSGGRVFTRGADRTYKRPDIGAFGVMIKGAAQLPAHLYQAEPVPYTYGSGTSPAAPHVSGVAALMLQAAKAAVPDVTAAVFPKAVKQALIAAAQTVDHLPVMVDAQKTVDGFVSALRPAS